jgi:hypothetical protein
MSVRLRLGTDDLRIAHALMSMNGSLAPGAEVTVPGDARLRFEGLSRGDDGLLEFVVGNERGLDPAAFADWLAGHLEGRVDQIRVGRREVKVEREAIRRALAGEIG